MRFHRHYELSDAHSQVNGAQPPDRRLASFVRENNIKTLNVAGSRGSKEPKVASFAKQALEDAFYPRTDAMVAQ
jgi:hypothetical protein